MGINTSITASVNAITWLQENRRNWARRGATLALRELALIMWLGPCCCPQEVRTSSQVRTSGLSGSIRQCPMRAQRNRRPMNSLGRDADPFGSLAIPEGPMALRPTLADGLPFSRLDQCTRRRRVEQPYVAKSLQSNHGQWSAHLQRAENTLLPPTTESSACIRT